MGALPDFPSDCIKASYLRGRVHVCVCDITTCVVDVIVNAANSTLLGGGGVDGAIHAVGGPAVLEECRVHLRDWPNGLRAGEAIVTTAGDLPSKAVIHTVGPIFAWDDNPKETLAACYSRSLALAQEISATSIAFPAISTGAFGFPSDKAAIVCSTSIAEHVASQVNPKRIFLVFFDDFDAQTFMDHQQFDE